MEFFEPTSLAEASRLVQPASTQCLAGGGVLVAKLNQHRIDPVRLVSLRNVAGLGDLVIEDDGGVVIGAMVTHAEVARAAGLRGGHQVVRDAASQIAHPGIRAMATIGGSLADAHPHADYPCALLAAGSDVVVEGRSGEYALSIDDFLIGPFATALMAGDIVKAVRLLPRTPGEGSTYEKFSRVDGDYATASVGIRLSLMDGRCNAIRIAVGGCGPKPFRVAQAEEMLCGTGLEAETVARAAALYAAAAQPVDDVKASAAYRRMIIPGLIGRALARAVARAKGNS